jgi:hypothetical protein
MNKKYLDKFVRSNYSLYFKGKENCELIDIYLDREKEDSYKTKRYFSISFPAKVLNEKLNKKMFDSERVEFAYEIL